MHVYVVLKFKLMCAKELKVRAIKSVPSLFPFVLIKSTNLNSYFAPSVVACEGMLS
jgi:hypothetical protein